MGMLLKRKKTMSKEIRNHQSKNVKVVKLGTRKIGGEANPEVVDDSPTDHIDSSILDLDEFLVETHCCLLRIKMKLMTLSGKWNTGSSYIN